MVRITIVGTGYVGLVTGACFAEVGHRVVCVDNDEKKVALLKAGGIPIYEPGLEELVARNTAAGRLRFTLSTAEGVEASEVIFIAVPTPPLPDGSTDLSFVERVAREVAGAMTEYKIVVDKSTVPVKTGEKVAETIKRYNKRGVDFDVASNPEFLREGSAVQDLMHPDRVVIGVTNPRPVGKLKEIYAPFNAPVIVTDINSAELIKHACNSFLAMKISYANLMAAVCETTGANVLDVVHGMGLDKRIGRAFLDAGLGYGGSCFPKDISAFIHIGEQLGLDFGLLREVAKINAQQIQRFLKKIRDTLWILKDKRIAVLGLSFKPNTDDMRLAPSVEVIRALLKDGAIIRAYDPKAMPKAREVLPEIEYAKDPYDAAHGADALVLCTEWDEFRQLDLERLRAVMAHPIVFDGRNVFDKERMKQLGFIYRGVGR
ncbi:MAG: UDP-glucose/GDP-mannose dehydrogenase family protein [Verrucomicrobiae bacterium]|nr:UDP-glucose/GDP-mannose dehydrogenase family protein [Verrucomicrobiae bacterium]MDW8343074.1 UDP-glucose/GDP-mannose dehydrogenase family protein [Verrucomicrobiae bacterium]